MLFLVFGGTLLMMELSASREHEIRMKRLEMQLQIDGYKSLKGDAVEAPSWLHREGAKNLLMKEDR